jgi:hypothetical protein
MMALWIGLWRGFGLAGQGLELGLVPVLVLLLVLVLVLVLVLGMGLRVGMGQGGRQHQQQQTRYAPPLLWEGSTGTLLARSGSRCLSVPTASEGEAPAVHPGGARSHPTAENA